VRGNRCVVVEGDLVGTLTGPAITSVTFPNTASVIARTAVLLDALDGTTFIAAVTGHDPSGRAADALMRARLEHATIAS
jgi:hypothetical protein